MKLASNTIASLSMSITGLFLCLFASNAYTNEHQEPAHEEPSQLKEEVPNILYVVPWSEIPQQKQEQPKIVIHDLIGDLYEPQLPDEKDN